MMLRERKELPILLVAWALVVHKRSLYLPTRYVVFKNSIKGIWQIGIKKTNIRNSVIDGKLATGVPIYDSLSLDFKQGFRRRVEPLKGFR